ncbi:MULTISPECIES: glutathione S-transferase N-terminal domain-containing protein [Pseudoalteromonas]|uniref:glutathione S-transferase N-terminal domain-containing protein n=1 Tax=Pseudoalteromonas TaxID=53246 RepID=UPI00029B3EEC|nr:MULTISPECIES: glutathione S-transferase N-terminal domain-containing protein [Pseudoalteromonas]QZO13645.1 glutathione S-transferase N-terminal domain-containing protein [Pseudoalteromonas piscicida]WMO14610.1 glutathione S-transferase N-terminal domain-containing protein [Pseudoalteromonas piscicida]
MKQLIWVIDSPYSRAIKWLLLHHDIAHDDYLLTWQNLKTDPLLRQCNPKQQVPTLIEQDTVSYDSLLIAQQILPFQWHQSTDAKIFRLGDADFEKAIIFFFRANLLTEKFGASEHSALLFEAGRQRYCSSVDMLFDHLLPQLANNIQNIELYIGVVLAFSTILACRTQAHNFEIDYYRLSELKALSNRMLKDVNYQQIIASYTNSADCKLTFLLP